MMCLKILAHLFQFLHCYNLRFIVIKMVRASLQAKLEKNHIFVGLLKSFCCNFVAFLQCIMSCICTITFPEGLTSCPQLLFGPSPSPRTLSWPMLTHEEFLCECLISNCKTKLKFPNLISNYKTNSKFPNFNP